MFWNWKILIKRINSFNTYFYTYRYRYSLLICFLTLFVLPNSSLAKEVQTIHPLAIKITNTPSEFYILVDTIKHQMIVKRNGDIYKIFPIAIGTDDTPTPIGEWQVISKSKDWGSGFGTRWLGLDVPWGIYGIHGTNKPHSIGRRASHGCVRMFNRDVETLFQIIPVGTRVTISGYILGAPWELPRRLVEGERGPDVLLIQQRLKYAGYYKGRCDGIYRGDLEYALRKFQLANHLPTDRNVSLTDYKAFGLEE